MTDTVIVESTAPKKVLSPWKKGGLVETIECNNATVFVNGANNQVNVLGNCWAVTVQGSYNTVVADHVTNDITVYGFNQTVLYKGGEPIVWDRGRELGMTNTINRVPA